MATTPAPTLESVRDDRSFFGHPRGLGLLFAAEMWERFSFYGMRGLLVLYLVNALKWSDGDAARLYGNYMSLVYLTPLVGGYIADRLLGTRNSLVIGGIVIAAGHFVMAIDNMATFYTGMGLVIVGTGFFKPNVSTMVGQLYAAGDPRRDAGFTVFYMGINLGAFLAPFVCSTLGEKVGWHYGFAAAGVGMVLGTVSYVLLRDKYLPGIGLAPGRGAAATAGAGGESPSRPWHGIVGGAAGLGVAALASSGNWVALLMGAVIGGAIGTAVLGTHGEERKRVIALFIVVTFIVLFWAAFEQAGSSMNLFADRHTDRTIGSFLMPTGWFQSVNSLFLLLFATVFAGLWLRLSKAGREPPTAFKMVIGLFLLGLGFVALVIGGRLVDAGGKVSPVFLLAAYLFHTWGELCVSPVGLSYVTKVAPVRFASLLMGVWFLANSAAGLVGGAIAAMTETVKSQAAFFAIPMATSIGASLLLLLLVPLLRRLTASVQA
ncbi:MAG: peptide MFS transporter [Gemmatimonadetes bacterium]|nr:peptide MFS transporter [Gemmatimonadota bacterium]